MDFCDENFTDRVIRSLKSAMRQNFLSLQLKKMKVVLKYKWLKKISVILKYKWRILVFDIVASLLILIFTYTATSKLSDYNSFRFTLGKSYLLTSFASVIAWLLPMTEIGISLLLFIPTFRKAGMLASFVLLTLLTVYLIYMLIYAQDLPCNCGGVISQLSWKQHVSFNLVLICLSFLGIGVYRAEQSKSSRSPPS